MIRLNCIALAMLVCGGFLVSSARAADATASATVAPSKAAATQPSNTNVTGTVSFTQDGDDVKVVADVAGLSPGKHGFHIHAKADMSDPHLVSAGGHWDMGHHHHGGPDTAEHHSGDLGNLVADDSGKAHLEGTLKGVKIAELAGKSVVVHAGEDDMKSDPAGNSGGRVAGGAIEVK
ncbi:MAG TPA: superoxide dismutase family protein [Tepidisphaeraceae bacterium]|jgi:Cu-Zn family superoxide dismutase|nr:superoxide dismutase family protein [Tepidisphaeraceae bacterium]